MKFVEVQESNSRFRLMCCLNLKSFNKYENLVRILILEPDEYLMPLSHIDFKTSFMEQTQAGSSRLKMNF